MKSSSLPLLALLALAAGCGTVSPAATLELPRERVTECRSLCTSVGLAFGAIVIVSNQAGCVCTPPPDGAATAASPAVILGATAASNLVLQESETDTRKPDQPAEDESEQDGQQQD